MKQRIRAVLLCLLGAAALGSIFVLTSRDVNSSDSKFQYAMKTIMRHEGGYTDDENDPGGVTKYGISLRFLKNTHIDPNGDGVEDKNDIINLSMTEADDIYYKEWYKKYHYDKIKDPELLTDIMDFSINAGASQAHKMVKRAIADVTNDEIIIDGKLDQKTIDMINLIEPVVLHAAINQEEEDFYRDLVKRHKQLRPFLRGWLRRAAE